MRFDWPTLALQAVNVLILLWLLRRFLFRPVVEIIAARKNAAEKLLSDAGVALKQVREAAESATRREQALAADSPASKPMPTASPKPNAPGFLLRQRLRRPRCVVRRTPGLNANGKRCAMSWRSKPNAWQLLSRGVCWLACRRRH